MSLPTRKPDRGIPVGRLVIILGIALVIALVVYGARGLFGMVKFTDFPITGEWHAKGKPWHLVFRADKSVVSSTGPSQSGPAQSDASQPVASETGTYKVNIFGNLWVMLKNGKTYSAELAPAPEEMVATPQNRFDLIESGTEAVTVFEKVLPEKPKPPASPTEPPGTRP